MSYGMDSDEVAEDYKKALEDLNMNSRYEISNLTVIAKENNEHAMAISEALKDHIKQIAPPKKLPAFYVMDSIVKNVGTPYTLFFGRNLYSTFMEAYALVDGNVRRKMEEMLQTWKQPVPGSLDTRPVFPPDVTRPIENALIKFRTSALQAHQEYARNQQQLFSRGRPGSAAPYRNTPTPPNAARQPYPGPNQPPYPQQGYPPAGNGAPYGAQPYPGQQIYPPSSSGTPASWQREQTPQQAGVNIDVLHADIAKLIVDSRAEFARNPLDVEVQKRLKALIDLQEILTRQQLPPDQISLIRTRVSDMMAQFSAPVVPAAAPAPAVMPLPIPSIPTVPAVTPTPPPAQQQPTLSSLFGPNALAALLGAQQRATPPQSTAVSAVPPVPAAVKSPQPRFSSVEPIPVPAPSVPAAAPNPNSLIEQLRAAGLLPASPAAPAAGIVPPPPNPASLLSMLPPQPAVPRTPLAEIPNDVQLNPNSLKIPRPHLISSLYEKLGAPCTQCGRRFKADDEGRRKKAAHMDWHFRVHQRMSDAEKRGQHRSWYVDELDWIKTREVDEADASPSNGADAPTASGPAKPKLQYVAVPNDPDLKNSMCPICQDKFETKWLDDAQDFVWMDAVQVGSRIYHASCYAEAKRDDSSVPSHQRGTPEPVLGKRKAEDDLPTRIKIKSEPF